MPKLRLKARKAPDSLRSLPYMCMCIIQKDLEFDLEVMLMILMVLVRGLKEGLWKQATMGDGAADGLCLN